MHMERIRCTDIRPDPRSGLTTSPDFDALAESIRTHGVLRPVLLRATSEGYVDDFPPTVVDCAAQQAA